MYTNNGYKWGQSEQRDRAVCMVYIYIPYIHEKKGVDSAIGHTLALALCIG